MLCLSSYVLFTMTENRHVMELLLHSEPDTRSRFCGNALFSH